MDFKEVFEGTGSKVDKILSITEKMNKIDSALSAIRYDNELLMEIPEVLKTLGAAKESLVAELKTL